MTLTISSQEFADNVWSHVPPSSRQVRVFIQPLVNLLHKVKLCLALLPLVCQKLPLSGLGAIALLKYWAATAATDRLCMKR
jgi:hypothetical protein